MSDQMLVTAARLLTDGEVCVAAPGAARRAARLARATHAPRLTVLGDDGTVDGVPAATVGAAEFSGYWLQGGRVDVGLLAADQVDAFGNVNTTVLGEYDEPTARLAGTGATPDVAAGAGRVVVLLPHRLTAFVQRVDFVTAPGAPAGPPDRAQPGLRGPGPVAVVTDLGVLRPDPATAELVLTEVHPGVSVDRVRAETGWPLEVAEEVGRTAPATTAEVAALRAG
ncbi:CoA-transferase [Pseudonocardia sp. RS010]|uniref:CoA-transferase n=1 Tax=Pseudonocardia sp. RS010 TaxID=3385979 RepID=UPI00399FCBA5